MIARHRRTKNNYGTGSLASLLAMLTRCCASLFSFATREKIPTAKNGNGAGGEEVGGSALINNAMKSEPPTDEQLAEILNRVQAILGEHCTGYVLIAEFDCGDGSALYPMTYGGGFARAHGLARRASVRMDSRAINADNPSDDDDDEDWKLKT